MLTKVRNSKWRWVLRPLIISAVCYLLLLLRRYILQVFFIWVGDPVAAQLMVELYGYFVFFTLLVLPLILCLLIYMYRIIVSPIRDKAGLLQTRHDLDAGERRAAYLEQYKVYAAKKASRWQTHAVYFLFFAMQIALLTQGVFFGNAQQQVPELQHKLTLLHSGSYLVYYGSFIFTERPRHGRPNPAYYYFETNIGTMRSVRANHVSNRFKRHSYLVRYLPGSRSHTVVSVTNSEGTLVTGPDAARLFNFDPPAGYWLFGDLLVRKNSHLPGYAALSLAARQAFDLIYGEYYSKGIARGDEGTRVFTLPRAITMEEYFTIIAMYREAIAARDFHPPWRYDTNDLFGRHDGMVRTMYAARGHTPQWLE